MGPRNFFGVRRRSDNLVPPSGEMHRERATSRDAYGLSLGMGRADTCGARLRPCMASALIGRRDQNPPACV